MKKRLLSMFCAVMIMIGCGGMVMVHNDGVVMAASAAAPYKTGDVSGDGVINTVDARMALQYIVQKIDLTGAALTAA
ncbi:MAG: hypothetical protein FWF44_09875, partial [Defluviitaleaceae bacterium]|nr:hypothetical protein [Defluviitaleaceae bacterium]